MTRSSSNEITSLSEVARLLAESKFAVRSEYFDGKGEYCWRNAKELSKAKLTGMSLPSSLGGQDAKDRDALQSIEETARFCALSAHVLAETNFGATRLIQDHGSDGQKHLAADYILKGDRPSVCGAEFLKDETEQSSCRAYREGGHYRLEGNIRSVRGGGLSRVLVVFAELFERDHSTGEIGCFLIIRDQQSGYSADGLKIETQGLSEGLRGLPLADFYFEGLILDQSMRILPTDDFGFEQSLCSMDIALSAITLGMTGRVLDLLKERIGKFDSARPASELHGLQWMISDMETRLYASRLMIRDIADDSAKMRDFVAVARAELFILEACQKSITQALHYFTAHPAIQNDEIERIYRDVEEIVRSGQSVETLRNAIVTPLFMTNEIMKQPQTADRTFLEAAE